MTLIELIIDSINLNEIKLIPPVPFWFIVGVTSLLILVFMHQSYKHLKRARKLEDSPTAKIRSAAQGHVVLTGEQHNLANHNNITRLSRLSCTWYRYTIQQYDQHNKSWRLLEEGRSSDLFMLQDDTGTCVIDPRDAEVSTPTVDSWEGFKRYPSKKPASWIGRLWGAALGSYRYTEWTMHDGMSLHAMGNFHTYTKETFAALYPDYSAVVTSDDTLHLLSKQGLDNQSPFILSAYKKQESVRKHRIEAFLWFLAYMTILAGLVSAVMIRIH
ncbi:MAG: GIDE domain-containing protein [Candidatus Berkiella sp.]